MKEISLIIFLKKGGNKDGFFLCCKCGYEKCRYLEIVIKNICKIVDNNLFSNLA